MAQFRFVYTARNYDVTTGFYRDTLGLDVVTSWDEHGRGCIFAAAGGGQIEVFEHVDDSPLPRFDGMKLAWEVSDVDTEHARLAAAGVEVLDPPTDRPWGHRNAAFAAPDGLVIVLFTVTDPSLE
jgi:catechol 2,3-dioxygenase-like lactoylglutathione lyase family enzyme